MNRPKPKYIQVQYTHLIEGGGVERCAVADASAISVYEGQPGTYRWLVDFNASTAGVHDALNWAKARAMRLGAELLDDTEI